MRRLLDGIARFRRDILPPRRTQFRSLANGQKPQMLMIGCADSRLVPCQKFGIEPGEVFTVRTAGAIVPRCGTVMGGEEASITLALKLGVQHVCLLAHTDCGAMKGLLNRELVADMPAMARMLDESGTRAEWVSSIVDAQKALLKLTELHVVQQLENLSTYPGVSDLVSARKLELHGLIFDIGTGDFMAFNSTTGRFSRV